MLTYLELSREIDGDPTSLGYATPYAAGAYDVVARLMNTPLVGYQVSRGLVPITEILSAIKPANIAASTNVVVGAWAESVFSADAIRLKTDAGADTAIMTALLSLLTAESDSVTALTALATRDGSRAEYLFGVGVSIAVSDIIKAQRYRAIRASFTPSTAITVDLHVAYIEDIPIVTGTTVTADLTIA